MKVRRAADAEASCPLEQEMATIDQTMETLPLEGRNRLDAEVLRRLYSYMVKCRMVEERIRVLYRQGRFAGNYFAAVGQEATEVGATLDLLPEDTVAGSHRNFVTNIMKGTPLTLLFMRWLRNYNRKVLRARGVNLDLAAPRMAAYMQTLDRPGWHPVLWIKKKWVLYEARRL